MGVTASVADAPSAPPAVSIATTGNVTAPQSADADRGGSLLSRSILHRRIEREPTGRWVDYQNPLSWPDTLLPSGTETWGLRILNLAALIVAQVVPASPERHLWSGLIMVTLLVFNEFWIRVDIGPIWRRYGVFAITTSLLAAAIAATPTAGIAAWSGYMLYASLFTGAPMMLCIAVSCVLMTAVQRNGWENLPYPWWASVLAWSLNVVIGLSVVAVIDARESSLTRRQELTDQLLAERARNSELHDALLTQARQSGVRDERARLARELHDTVAQGFVAVVTQLESIDEDELARAVRDRLDNAKSLARQGLTEARQAVNALAPITAETRSLAEMLRDHLTGFGQLHPHSTTLRVDGVPRQLDADATLVRLTQEALINVAKHANASTVVLTLTYLDDTLILDIRDDGCGFSPDTVRRDASGGYGLTVMRERAQLIGARIEVESEPSNGCVISVSVPFSAQSSEV